MAPADPRERLAAYKHGRALFEQAGLPEYAMGYFGKEPCLADFAYYRLDMDWVGFGAGANSLLGGEYLLNHAQLPRFNAQPLTYAHRGPAIKAAHHMVYHGLTLYDGLVVRRWQERLGAPFAAIVARPDVRAQLDSLAGRHLVRDAEGVRIPRERIADVLLTASQSAPSAG